MRPPGPGARQQRTVDAGRDLPSTLMALGVLLTIVIFWAVGQRTFVSFTVLLRWFALFAFAGNLLPRRWYAKWFGMDRMEWFWFNLLAIGPLIFCSCLALNFFVHGPEHRMLVQAGRSFNLHEYWRNHDGLPPHQPWPDDLGADPEKDRLAFASTRPDDKVYTLAEGMFGYLVITRVDVVRELQPAPDN